jgi:hypothetical membrane protein
MSTLSIKHVAGRVKTFSDKYPLFGPIIWMLSALYFLAQIAVGWVWTTPYSVIHNTISDLGNTACGQYRGSYVCSPRHEWMNISFILLGIVMVVGSVLIYQEFTERRPLEQRVALVGFSCLTVAGIGTMFVGIFPENTVSAMHVTGAALAIGVGNVGILLLGVVLPLPEGLRGFMLFFSALSLAAAVSFAGHKYFGIGAGGMERIAAYPETVWLIRFGIYISRNHYSKSSTSAWRDAKHRRMLEEGILGS